MVSCFALSLRGLAREAGKLTQKADQTKGTGRGCSLQRAIHLHEGGRTPSLQAGKVWSAQFQFTLPPVLLDLLPHPALADDSPHPLKLQANAYFLDSGELCLDYQASYSPGTVILPPPTFERAVDGLWLHTCCEVFIGVSGEAAYREFNFSPSTEWAGYQFMSYRERCPEAPPLPAPQIDCQRREDGFHLSARLPHTALPVGHSLRLGLTAVIQTPQGLSYWALHHAGPKPDFHLADSFTLSLSQTKT